MTADEREDDDRELRVVARLLPGESMASIDAELAMLARTASEGNRTAWADGLQQTEVGNIERALTALFAHRS